MAWKETTMKEAFNHGRSRQIAESVPEGLFPPDGEAEICAFTDGTAVACRSVANGPMSRDTPDLVFDTPQWWIYENHES